MKRRSYPSGAAKRRKNEEKTNECSQQKNTLRAFFVPKDRIPSEESPINLAVENEDSEDVDDPGNDSHITGLDLQKCTGTIDIPSISRQTKDVEVPNKSPNVDLGGADDGHPRPSDLRKSQASSCSEDIGLWPDVITDSIRDQFISKPPTNIGNISALSSQHLEGDRLVTRRLTETHFVINKTNGTREKREWLIFSETSGCVYCYVCKLFSKNKSLMMSGCKDWKNLGHKLSTHENSYDHKNAMLTISRRMSDKGCIDSNLVTQIQTEVEYWRAVLRRIVATVQFLASHGLSFRGHDEKSTTNKGNFLGCLEYLAKFDTFLANHIVKYGNRGSGSVSYLSNATCDEFISIMANTIRSKLIEEVKVATYFSLIVDSTPDVSHVDQLTFVLRYVLPNGAIMERFFSFVDIHGHSAEYLENVILETLSKWGIDISKCRGQSYDNASNMSGKYTGLQARIKTHSASAEYIPCSSHSLNLVGNSAAESSVTASEYFDFVQNVYTFFSQSTHRWNILIKHIGNSAHTIKRVSDTRWSARADAVLALRTNYMEVKDALTEISNDENQKSLAKLESKALLKKMEKYDTALMTVLWNTVLQRMNATSKSLQKSDLCLTTAVALLQSLATFIQDVRNDFQKIEDEASPLITSAELSYHDEGRRHKKRKVFFDETPDNEVVLSGKQKFVVNTMNVVCDRLIAELNKRMDAYKVINTRFGIFFNFNEDLHGREFQSMIEELKTAYHTDIECANTIFEEEVRHFVMHAKAEKLQTPVEMYQLILGGLKSTFPNVETILRIFMTIPVSNASGERSFSVLKRVKSYLRNSMGQERMDNLALLCIESEETNKIHFEEQIDAFAKMKARKKSLL